MHGMMKKYGFFNPNNTDSQNGSQKKYKSARGMVSKDDKSCRNPFFLHTGKTYHMKNIRYTSIMGIKS
jgi:hypothetical protein